jgi:hypothetical protein
LTLLALWSSPTKTGKFSSKTPDFYHRDSGILIGTAMAL